MGGRVYPSLSCEIASPVHPLRCPSSVACGIGGVVSTALTSGKYSGTIVLADISGYTVFLEDVRLEHADDSFADGQIPYA